MPSAKSARTSGTSAQQIELPSKKYFTIGEVSKLCDVKTHVLRYWEQVFPQLEPNKRQGRRYYQHRDVELVLEIKSLLHDQGFTISGAKAQLAQPNAPLSQEEATPAQKTVQQLQQMRQDLAQFKQYILNKY